MNNAELELRVAQTLEDNKAVIAESRKLERQLKASVAKQHCLVEQIRTLTRKEEVDGLPHKADQSCVTRLRG